MRWLVAHPGPHFSVSDVFDGWVEGLQDIGEQVVPFHTDAFLLLYETAHIREPDDSGWRKAFDSDGSHTMVMEHLAAALWRTRPDILMLVSAFTVDLDLLDYARSVYGTRVVVLHTESPYEDERQLEVAGHADVNLLNDAVSVEKYKQVCANSFYMPHAYRPKLHHPGPALPGRDADLVFIGTGYPSRIDFLSKMDLDGLDVRLLGNWESLPEGHPLERHLVDERDQCTDNTDTADWYRSARSSLNLYRREIDEGGSPFGWAMGPREVEMAACGLFFIRESRGESDEVLGDLPLFSDPADAGAVLRWWLAHPAACERAAAKAREAIEPRTFANHAAQLRRLFNA